jgi:hypothetical protein
VERDRDELPENAEREGERKRKRERWAAGKCWEREKEMSCRKMPRKIERDREKGGGHNQNTQP